MAPSVSVIHSNPLSLLDFVVNKGHGVKGLSELGLETLPHQYIQPPQERLDASNEESNKDSIPVIDMSNWDDPEVAQAICDAARKWGFFQIVNHRVPIHVLEDVKDATLKFFALPAEEKLKYSKERSVTNNIRFGTSFTPETEKALEWKDYLSLFFVSVDEAASLWPPICRNQALDYIEASELIVKKLLKILMNGLNVKEIDESTESILMGSKRINLNYYPKCPNPELTVGVGRHSDVSTLTVLLQDDIGGLFVRNTETMKWIHVPPVSGSLVINVGDALQIISNGHYKSVEHRVSANGNGNRISVPIFVCPRPSDIIGPLPEVVQNGEKPLYKHILYSDYVKHFFRKAHDGKATIDFAKGDS
ncbi:2-oxoglutarate (2OG) and Fe(II)-dependent oxygenase superfamily protein [Artemisia annua]|uniref:feruloyl-CoA 6-hydroxylase n=1 Tax=Artemisia annua TaxID=35608 RepID=A0A2U1NRR2_ARTAN|nr:2-oxoglutarate (2OG) and Fe(II)-dependent oxygenase superfamily protein [Artemisia annua]